MLVLVIYFTPDSFLTVTPTLFHLFFFFLFLFFVCFFIPCYIGKDNSTNLVLELADGSVELRFKGMYCVLCCCAIPTSLLPLPLFSTIYALFLHSYPTLSFSPSPYSPLSHPLLPLLIPHYLPPPVIHTHIHTHINTHTQIYAHTQVSKQQKEMEGQSWKK